MRYYKIFNDSNVDVFVVASTGLTTDQIFRIGAAVAGSYRKRPRMVQQEYGVIGVDVALSRKFFERMTINLADIKKQMAQKQAYDGRWIYTWNPLIATPLISIDPLHPERILCPIPSHIMRRITQGLYYDLYNRKGFDNAFGASFELYIGELLRQVCRKPMTIIRPAPYDGSKGRKHGLDWVLTDGMTSLAIECKTKRLTLDSKFGSDFDALDRDLDVMASALTQCYKNISDAHEGQSHWDPGATRVLPVVITLEDWFFISPVTRERLANQLLPKLKAAGVPPTVLDEMPFTVASASEFEVATQVFGKAGLTNVMNAKTQEPQRGWALLPFLISEFNSEVASSHRHIFGNDFRSLHMSITNQIPNGSL